MDVLDKHCCFFCLNYKHLDPDTDVCACDNHEVFFDTLVECDMFDDGENL